MVLNISTIVNTLKSLFVCACVCVLEHSMLLWSRSLRYFCVAIVVVATTAAAIAADNLDEKRLVPFTCTQTYADKQETPSVTDALFLVCPPLLVC